jgi:NAD(P)H-dependent FMN reductase
MSTIILGLGGSLRLGSTTTLALQSALTGAQEAGAQTRLMDLATLRLPLFNGTYTLDGYTSAERKEIMTLLEAADEAQGFILASPTYHNTISGSLKNALDILEILNDDRPSRLAGKVVGIMTVQGGTSGTGVNTLTTMLLAARAMGAWVAPTMVSLPGSREAFDETGLIHDLYLDQRLHSLGAEVARVSAMFAVDCLVGAQA